MRKKKKGEGAAAVATQLRTEEGVRFGSFAGRVPLGGGETALYRGMRNSIPILDAAIGKLTRLVGGCSVTVDNPRLQKELEDFWKHVPVGRGQMGMENFLGSYIDSLLTYGRAVGEVVVGRGGLEAVVWGDVTRLELKQGKSPLEVTLLAPNESGQMVELPRQELLLFSTLHPEVGSPYGVSILRSMPFLAEILMKVYETVGRNWERAGNVRYAVVMKPGNESLDRNLAEERSGVIASQWAKAMEESRNGAVRDFVAVGDVEIKVIGADGQILDSEVPVRQLLEQLVARTGLPPFLLGLSWSTSERMSQQQADLLTSELWAIRRSVEPVLEKILRLWMRFRGYQGAFSLEWEDICLQDAVEEAKAELYRVQAENLREEKE